MSTAFNRLIILLLLFFPVFAQNWQQLYDQALQDLEAARWEDAIGRLQEAVKQQPSSGQSVTGEKGQTIRYFPYYLLGKAHFHLGKYAEAADFFARESSQPNVPVRLAEEISGYQQQIRAALARRKQLDFNRAVERAEAARGKQAFAEAAAELERARGLDSAEFKKKGLDSLLANMRGFEKKRADESRYRLLVKQADEKEKQNALQEASSILEEADRLFPGRFEVDQIRVRIQEREENYASLKEAAANDEKEGRLDAAADKLRQAAQADPQRFISDGLREKLAQFAVSISREADIQRLFVAAAKAFAEGDYAEAIANYDKVLEKDRANSVAAGQKRRAESLQLIAQAQNLMQKGAFREALAAFSLSRDRDPDNGELIYERMRPHTQTLIRRQSGLRSEWLELMREADSDRFRRENPGGTAAAQRPRQGPRQAAAAPPAAPPAKPKPAEERGRLQQEVVFAAIQGPPEEAVRLLEKLKATRGESDAELESWTGVAYARLSLLTSNPEERKKLHSKATEHFKLALKMDPRHELNPRLVAPDIQRIFSEAQQGQ